LEADVQRIEPVSPPDATFATREDLLRLEKRIANLAIAVENCLHHLQIQFTRIAELQAEIDLIRGEWAKPGEQR
jgi:hypothetical protein